MHKHNIHSLATTNYPTSPRRNSLPPPSHQYSGKIQRLFINNPKKVKDFSSTTRKNSETFHQKPENIQRLFRLQNCLSRRSSISRKYSKNFRPASSTTAASSNQQQQPASSIPTASSNQQQQSAAATSKQYPAATSDHPATSSNQQQQSTEAISYSNQQQSTAATNSSNKQRQPAFILLAAPTRSTPASVSYHSYH